MHVAKMFVNFLIMILTTNSDSFPKQHPQIGVYVRYEFCSL